MEILADGVGEGGGETGGGNTDQRAMNKRYSRNLDTTDVGLPSSHPEDLKRRSVKVSLFPGRESNLTNNRYKLQDVMYTVRK